MKRIFIAVITISLLVIFCSTSFAANDDSLFDNEAHFLDLSTVSHDKVQETAELLASMPNLEEVELGTQADREGESALTFEDIEILMDAAPQADFNYQFSLFDRTVNLSDEELDLNHIKMHDEGELVRQSVSCMKHLRYLCMDTCNVSNESMEKIRDDFPDVDVVWRIWFGKTYSVRTDVEKILASKPSQGGVLYDSKLEVLKYCTKVKYLDLGHNDVITDISFVNYMPDLEVCILAMNKLGDISPLSNCKKLEYLELFYSDGLTDLSPLSEHENLRHLNIGMCNNLKDISPLYDLDLDRLYIGCITPIPAEQIEKYRELHPDCDIDDYSWDTSIGSWRYTTDFDDDPEYLACDYYRQGMHPRFALLREQFGYDSLAYSFMWLDPNY